MKTCKVINGIKAVVRKIGADNGWLVCRSHKYPVCTVSMLDLAIPAMLNSRREETFSFAQVGASDGVTADPLQRMVQRYQAKGIMIEPLAEPFKQLKQKYPQESGVICLNCAVGDRDGYAEFFVPASRDEISVSQKSGLSKDSLIKAGVREETIVRIKVPILTLETIFRQNGLQRVDVLQVDAEGYDFKILKQALELKAIPRIIHFESMHLIREERLLSREMLLARGYGILETETDTLAFLPMV